MPFNNLRLAIGLLAMAVILTAGCTGHFLAKNRTAIPADSDRFVLVTAVTGDTFASLAETHLKDRSKGWQIAAINGIESLSPGQRLIIPLVPITVGGLQKNGYQTVPVLVYTAMAKKKSRSDAVTEQDFHRQLDDMGSNGFFPVSLDQFHAFLELKSPLPPKAVVITFDTTDAWAYDIAYPALKQRKMRGAFFINPEQVGKKGNVSWPQLAKMTAAGMVIGLYGSEIKTPDKEDVSAHLENFEAALTGPQKLFMRHLDQPCSYFAYPRGESNDLTIAMLKKHGYKAAFTRKRGGNPFFVDNFKIRRAMINGRYTMARFRQNLNTFHPAELK